ncbi:MAG: BtpA/SgcQ family protein [Chlorobi bacterium]|nr:BtpA/SgcQ family protein [Chlorobiota bacterium]
MKNFKSLFPEKKPIIGMIHLQALPGTPFNKFSPKVIIEKAVEEAKIYLDYGIDSILIENMHDLPYLNRNIGHEITSLMSIIGYEIKKITNLPIGIQVLAGANMQAISVAYSANLDYIRAEGFVFAHIADEGLMNADAAELLRFRKQIGAGHILVFADIKKKHSSHSITKDLSILETAKAAIFSKCDGVIITGNATSEPIHFNELEQLAQNIDFPIIAGSGITKKNIATYYPHCDAFIVGSYFKKDGLWSNEIDKKRIMDLMKIVADLRK